MADAKPKRILAPQPGTQIEFLQRPETEVLFGGEAGGGKSWCLIVEPLRYVQHKDFSAVIFRRNYPDLEDLIHKTMDIYTPLGAAYTMQNHTFTFPSGARIKFSHLNHIKDMYNHQGAEYSYIGFDELTQFPKLAYLYLFSRLRGPNPDIKRYIRSTANPDGEGMLWVKARFIDNLQSLQPKWFLTSGDRDVEVSRETIGAISRCFVPSIRSDNKILMDADPGYEARLNQLPEAQKNALKYGIWRITDKPDQLITADWLQRALEGKCDFKPGFWACGADYAEMGKDKCVTVLGKGNQPFEVREYDYQPTSNYARILADTVQPYGYQARLGVDSIGPGWGVYSDLQTHHSELKADVNPCRHKDEQFDADMKSKYGYQFDNWKSQAYWKLRCDFEAGNIDLSQLQGEAGYYENLRLLQEEILSITYKVANGKIIIAPKSELRKVQMGNGQPGLGRSPDRADALCIWNWVREFEYHAIGDPLPASVDYGGYLHGTAANGSEGSPWV